MTQLSFDDSAAYERFIGRCGRDAGSIFLDWIDPPRDAAWLDVGCGTGLFTELIHESCSPATVFGIDPAEAQIAYANRKAIATRANFRIADAQSLPFGDAAFDVVVSALAINFIPDRLRALAEMRRVVRPAGLVAGYVWDFSAELSPSGPFRLGLREVAADVPALPGTEDSRVCALHALFQHVGFAKVETRTIDIEVAFPDFQTFWDAQMPSYAPTTRIVVALDQRARARLEEAVRAHLRTSSSGRISYPARANAVRAAAAPAPVDALTPAS
jgi:ubiquinone/menaquinone biosynthesis C-methylase UbiE